MRVVARLVVVAWLLVGGVLAGGGAPVVHATVAPATVTATSHLTPGPGNETTILDRETLYETEVHGGRDDYDATLYFVAEDGTWYRAFPTGSIGAPAPDGDEIPLLSGETHEVPREERPKYLWKVVSDDECSTTFYDAENVSDAAAIPIPNCPPRTRPTPTPTPIGTSPAAGREPGASTPTTMTRKTTTAGQPGFGVSMAIGSMVAAGLLAARRRK